MLEFHHNKSVDMPKLGCTLPNLAKICLHSSTSAKFFSFTKSDTDLLAKFLDDMVGGPSVVFTRKVVKLLSMRLSSASPKMFANRLLE